MSETSGSAKDIVETASEKTTPATAEIKGAGLVKRPWRPQVTAWEDITGHDYAGSGTETDPFVVTWLPTTSTITDRENPITFRFGYKWLVTITAALATLGVSMGSSLLSAAMVSIIDEFPGQSSPSYILVTSIYVAGFAIGPLLWAPCSEVFGRRAMFIFTYIPFTLFNAGASGAPTLTALLILRFFAGTFGSSAMTNSGGVIADIFEAHQRGLAMGIFACAPFLGPAIGPVAGGFLAQDASWRWAASVIAIFAFTITVAGFFLLPETYAPVLLRKRATALSRATGQVYRTQQDIAKPLHTRELFLRQLQKPWALFFKEPIVFLTATYLAVIYAILYMQFTAFPLVFEEARGWSSGLAGLAFIGITIGSFMALAYIVFLENPRYAARSKAEGGHLPPEQRLPSVIVGAILLPIGLFVFAWTGVPTHIPWIAPLLSTVPYGAGTVLLFLGISNYLVDTYLMYAASVLAAGTVFRSIFGVVLPLFTTDIYDSLGINWGGTLVAFLAAAFAPVPFVFYLYGKRIRSWSSAAREAEDLATKMITARRQAVETEQVAQLPSLDQVEAALVETTVQEGGADALSRQLSLVESLHELRKEQSRVGSTYSKE